MLKSHDSMAWGVKQLGPSDGSGLEALNHWPTGWEIWQWMSNGSIATPPCCQILNPTRWGRVGWSSDLTPPHTHIARSKPGHTSFPPCGFFSLLGQATTTPLHLARLGARPCPLPLWGWIRSGLGPSHGHGHSPQGATLALAQAPLHCMTGSDPHPTTQLDGVLPDLAHGEIRPCPSSQTVWAPLHYTDTFQYYLSQFPESRNSNNINFNRPQS